jgi:hypothetical protein
MAGTAQAANAEQLRGVQLAPNVAFSTGPMGQSDGADTAELSSACALGARVVREFVSWKDLEMGGPGLVNGAYVAKLDSLMQQAASCHLKVIFDLLGTPPWDTVAPWDPAWSTFPAKDGASSYRWMVSWILQRWPELHGLEVWNEPNLANWWRGTPEQYADLVNAAVTAKRDTGAQTQILAGALAPPASSYLQSLYSAGMQGQDAVSIHPYPAICSPLGCQQYDPAPPSPFTNEIDAIHQTMVANGDAGGMWLTEFGVASCPAEPTCVPEDVQADWITKCLRIAAGYPYVDGLIIFTLRDVPAPSGRETLWHYHFGLTNTDLTPKPAYAQVKDTLQALDPATSGTSAPPTPATAPPSPTGAPVATASAAAPAGQRAAGPTGLRTAALRKCGRRKGESRRRCAARARRLPN